MRAAASALLACTLQLLCCRSEGLMFRSDNVTSQWDTWVFVENQTFYLFYLVTEHSPGEGFGVATSSDGQHWNDRGFVYHSPSWAEHGWWMGTGSVWRAADFAKTGRYIVNWSQAPGKDGQPNNGSDPWRTAGYQNISFAESYDLIHWSRPAPLATTYFSADTRYYNDFLPCGSRWDCIYSIPVPQEGRNLSARDGYPRYGYWTASPLHCGCSGFCNQSMGFGMTEDGFNWKALSSPLMDPPTVHWSEVGAVEYIEYTGKPGGAYFAMLGGNQNEKADMISYSAASPTGPFKAATKNYVLLPQVGSCYFSRFFRNDGELLVTHQTFSREGRTHVAPFKAVEADEEGTLRLKWWAPNDALQGQEVPMLLTPATHRLSWLSPEVDKAVGMIIRTKLLLPLDLTPSTSTPGTATPTATVEASPGFMFAISTGGQQAAASSPGILVAVDHAARVSAYNVTDVRCPVASNLSLLNTWDRDLGSKFRPGSEVDVRLLYRDDMIELYLEDYLMVVYSIFNATGSMTNGSVGLFNANNGEGTGRYKLMLPAKKGGHLHSDLVSLSSAGDSSPRKIPRSVAQGGLPPSRPFSDSFRRPNGALANGWIEGWAATGNFSQLGLHGGAVTMIGPTIRNGTYPPPCNSTSGSIPPGDIIAGVGCAWRETGATSIAVSVRWSGLWQFPHHIESSPLLHVTPGTLSFGMGIWPSILYGKPVFLVGAIGDPGRFFDVMDAALFNHTDGHPREISVQSDGAALRFFLDGAAVKLNKAGYGPLPIPPELRGSTLHGFAVDTHCVSPYQRATDLPAITEFKATPASGQDYDLPHPSQHERQHPVS